MTTMPPDTVVGTSFDEKSGSMHGRRVDVVDINPDDHSTQDEDGQGVL